jgi:hypothetical protein
MPIGGPALHGDSLEAQGAELVNPTYPPGGSRPRAPTSAL